MSQGVVTHYLVSLIRKQVEDHALVVWYDPEKHYREVAATLMLPKTQVARYDGSFFQLRHEIDSLLNDLQPSWLVVYVPLDQTRTGHALIELEAVGVVIQPGQQPPSRNTRLSVVARNALKPILSEESAADVERQVEAGKLSLADLDALADTGEGITKGVVSLIFGSGNPQDVALAFLASDRHDAEVEKKTAVAELAGLLQDVFGVEPPNGEPLPALRSRLGRYVLSTDLIAGLRDSVPPSLSSVKVAAKPAAREACLHLARTWRLRRDVRESYVAASKQVETELGLSQVELPPDRLAEVETFLAVERALLRQVESGLLDHPTEELLTLAESRLSGFWSEVLPGIQAHWALIAKAAHVLLEADRVAQATKGKTDDALALIRSYAEGDRPWCLLDSHYRHMESRWYNFESESGQRHESLERLVLKATERYMKVGSALAEHFLGRYRQTKLPLKGIVRQTEVDETLVRPSLAEGKTAYLWVDALRFEMARELCGVLADDFELTLQSAIGTAPTITEIGMAAPCPVPTSPRRSSRRAAASWRWRSMAS